MSRYSNKIQIGKGNFGIAYLIKKNGIDIILKEMNLSKLTSEKDKRNVKAEVETIQKLNNRYIVHYIDSYFEKEFIYIEMEYCKYGDLERLITYLSGTGNYLSEEGVLKYFVDVLLGLKYLHDRNICHRDLKPANIFITFDGGCAIGDFGLSKMVEPNIQMQSLAGTPLYMAPEMLTNERNYGIQVDIWALGCILHELCARITAFSGKNLIELIQNVHLKPSTPIPSFFSSDMSELIDKMLTKQPEKRPTANELLASPYIKNFMNNVGPWVLYKYQTVRCSNEPIDEKSKGYVVGANGSNYGKKANSFTIQPIKENDKDKNKPIASPEKIFSKSLVYIQYYN